MTDFEYFARLFVAVAWRTCAAVVVLSAAVGVGRMLVDRFGSST